MSLSSYLSEENDFCFVDLNGVPVDRMMYSYLYNYDGFVVWQRKREQNECLKNCHTVYSDRLYQWDWKRFNKCCEEVFGNSGQYFDNRKPEDIEKFLSLYFGKTVKLHVVMQYCNQSTGFPYWRFDYEEMV